jgi:hypothetical protein
MRTKEEIRKEIDAVDETIKLGNDYKDILYEEMDAIPETIKVTLHLTPDEIIWLNMVRNFGGEISSVMCGKKIVGKPTEYPVSEYNKWNEVQYGLFNRVRIKPDEDQD